MHNITHCDVHFLCEDQLAAFGCINVIPNFMRIGQTLLQSDGHLFHVSISLLFPSDKHSTLKLLRCKRSPQQSVTCSTNQYNFDNSLSVLQATADVTTVDRPQQFVANTQSDAFFGDVYRSAQDDVLTDVIGRRRAVFLCVSMTWS